MVDRYRLYTKSYTQTMLLLNTIDDIKVLLKKAFKKSDLKDVKHVDEIYKIIEDIDLARKLLLQIVDPILKDDIANLLQVSAPADESSSKKKTPPL